MLHYILHCPRGGGKKPQTLVTQQCLLWPLGDIRKRKTPEFIERCRLGEQQRKAVSVFGISHRAQDITGWQGVLTLDVVEFRLSLRGQSSGQIPSTAGQKTSPLVATATPHYLQPRRAVPFASGLALLVRRGNPALAPLPSSPSPSRSLSFPSRVESGGENCAPA